MLQYLKDKKREIIDHIEEENKNRNDLLEDIMLFVDNVIDKDKDNDFFRNYEFLTKKSKEAKINISYLTVNMNGWERHYSTLQDENSLRRALQSLEDAYYDYVLERDKKKRGIKIERIEDIKCGDKILFDFSNLLERELLPFLNEIDIEEVNNINKLEVVGIDQYLVYLKLLDEDKNSKTPFDFIFPFDILVGMLVFN